MTDQPGRPPEERLPAPRPPSAPVVAERFSAPPSARRNDLTPERVGRIVRQSANARWVGFLAVTVVALFVIGYYFYELGLPNELSQPRLEAAAQAQQVIEVERGYNLYQANCAQCHGANGEGGKGPILNSQEKLYAHLNPDFLRNMLTAGGRYACGNPNTIMPVWANTGSPPGPLNYKQIDYLIAFIRASKDETFRVLDPSLGEPVTSSGEEVTFTGWVDPAYTPAPGSTPYPACWSDSFKTPAPSGSASAAAAGSPGASQPATGGTVIKEGALNIAFTQAELTAPADVPFQIEFNNGDAGVPHNIEIKDASGATVFKGDLVNGVTTTTYNVPALKAGTYPFICSVHPNMIGTLKVGSYAMAQTALPAPGHVAPRRRVFFGLFNADGWPWAIVKSLFWFVVIIMMLGYIPDRAYYFTVQKTVDLGLLVWSPVNFCPPENETLPCPAPAGATIPWHPGESQASLLAPRTGGAAAVIGTNFLFAGGSDGTKPAADTYLTKSVASSNIDTWKAGPALPEARADAAVATLGNTMYVIGGYGPDGKATTTVYSLTIANDGSIGQWVNEEKLVLPAPRAGSSAVPVSDGLVVLGGTDGTAATKSVWKTQLDSSSKLGPWKDQGPMFEESVDGYAAHVGDIIFVIGGRDKAGTVVATVQQGFVGGPSATAADPNVVHSWRASAQTNLPAPRSNMSGFTTNGVIYVQGGTDGVSPRTEALWTTPDAEGVIDAWHHLAQTDLGQGLEGSAGVVSGSYGFLFGGTTEGGVTAGAARANLAPQPPFFQLGILGATIPGLKLDGEVGQQIGYLNAATVGAVNFILLIVIGYLYAHPAKVSAFLARRRRKG